MWGYGLLSSATAGAALQAAMRFLPLSYAFSTISTRVLEHSVEVHFGEPDLAPGLGRLLVERDLAAAAMLMRQVAGDGFRLDRIALKALPGRIGAPPAGIHDILGAVPDFKAGEYLIAYDRAYLARPLPQADPATAAMCERMCQKLMEQRRVDIGCAAMVRHRRRAAARRSAQPAPHRGPAAYQRAHAQAASAGRRDVLPAIGGAVAGRVRCGAGGRTSAEPDRSGGTHGLCRPVGLLAGLQALARRVA